jgi:hypothetical protein
MKTSTRPLYKKKRFIIPSVIILILLAVRIVLPGIILRQANQQLATFSPVLNGEISEIKLSIHRGSYLATGININLKSNNKTILTVDELRTGIAWSEIFKGRILANIEAVGAEIFVTQDVIDELKRMPPREVEEVKRAVPFHLESFDLKDSRIVVSEFGDMLAGQEIVVSDIHTRVTNLTPTARLPFSFFNMTATMPDSASQIKSSGKINLQSDPIEWDADGELHSFDLSSINEILKEHIPITFNQGKLDVFAEAKSQGGVVEGYIKPFMSDLKIIKGTDYKGPRHRLIELVAGLGHLLLRNIDSESIATRIPFEFDGNDLNIGTGEAIDDVLQHGYDEKLPRGIENRYSID